MNIQAALITGASRGLGEALARGLAARGVKLALVGREAAPLEQMGRIWAAELEGTGVAVTIVDPGEMDTRMHSDAMPEADRSTLAPPSRVAPRLISLIESGLQSGARVTL